VLFLLGGRTCTKEAKEAAKLPCLFREASTLPSCPRLWGLKVAKEAKEAAQEAVQEAAKAAKEAKAKRVPRSSS
jgi:hypothetical protein